MAARRSYALWIVSILIGAATLSTAGAVEIRPLERGTSTLRALDLSQRADVDQYFRAMGIDPASVIYQYGSKNYAGPNCPGKDWTCTSSNGPVYQNSDDGENEFECDPAGGGTSDPDTCVIVQSTISGTNEADCEESSESNGVALSCDITQDNSFGDNKSSADQAVELDSGVTQSATLYTTIVQTNDFGKNEASVSQDLSQAIGSGGPTQTQTGFVHANVDQYTSASGDNEAEVSQELKQREAFSGKTAITQNQNTSGSFMGSEANVFALIDQESDGGGENDGHLDQKLDEGQSAKAKSASVTQTQGQIDGGIEGEIHQNSTGEAHAQAEQDEIQTQSAKTSGSLTQTQIGPVRCCSDQFSNEENDFEISQEATQRSGSGATQSQLVEGECHTSGNCEVDQKVTVQGSSTENSCSGEDCNIGIECEGTECTPFDASEVD